MAEFRGVNLGHWLVLEGWMDRKLFEGIGRFPKYGEDAGGPLNWDETTWCIQKGADAKRLLTEHRDSFITLEDFKWIKNAGLNSVRIPVPHWIFGDYEPNIGCIEYLDKAFDWANQTGIKILIDLHCAPGSQNGEHHGGLPHGIKEFEKEENIARAVDVVGKLANRYKDEKNLYGIQLLNEPMGLDWDRLKEYYTRGYHEVRKYCDENVTVAMHDGFDMHQFTEFMQTPEYKNVSLDIHIYLCYEGTKRLSRNEQMALFDKYVSEIKRTQQYFKVIIGEFSCSMDVSPDVQIGYWKDHLNPLQKALYQHQYAAAQLICFEQADGWFFWNYRLGGTDWDQWSYRKSVERGWIPAKLV